MVHQVDKDVFLGGVVDVELPHRYARFLGDLADGRSMESFSGKEPQSGALDLQLVLLDGSVKQPGHRASVKLICFPNKTSARSVCQHFLHPFANNCQGFFF